MSGGKLDHTTMSEAALGRGGFFVSATISAGDGRLAWFTASELTSAVANPITTGGLGGVAWEDSVSSGAVGSLAFNGITEQNQLVIATYMIAVVVQKRQRPS